MLTFTALKITSLWELMGFAVLRIAYCVERLWIRNTQYFYETPRNPEEPKLLAERVHGLPPVAVRLPYQRGLFGLGCSAQTK